MTFKLKIILEDSPALCRLIKALQGKDPDEDKIKELSTKLDQAQGELQAAINKNKNA